MLEVNIFFKLLEKDFWKLLSDNTPEKKLGALNQLFQRCRRVILSMVQLLVKYLILSFDSWNRFIGIFLNKEQIFDDKENSKNIVKFY